MVVIRLNDLNNDLNTSLAPQCYRQAKPAHKRLKFTPLIISPETASTQWFLIMKLLWVPPESLPRVTVSEHEVTLGSAREPTKCNIFWPCTLTWPFTSSKKWCFCSLDALVTSTHLCFALTQGLNLVEKQQRVCLLDHQNNGTHDHQNCIFIGSKSWWGLEQSVFGDRETNKSHAQHTEAWSTTVTCVRQTEQKTDLTD